MIESWRTTTKKSSAAALALSAIIRAPSGFVCP
jgi:hypothetical protein